MAYRLSNGQVLNIIIIIIKKRQDYHDVSRSFKDTVQQ